MFWNSFVTTGVWRQIKKNQKFKIVTVFNPQIYLKTSKKALFFVLEICPCTNWKPQSSKGRSDSVLQPSGWWPSRKQKKQISSSAFFSAEKVQGLWAACVFTAAGREQGVGGWVVREESDLECFPAFYVPQTQTHTQTHTLYKVTASIAAYTYSWFLALQ